MANSSQQKGRVAPEISNVISSIRNPCGSIAVGARGSIFAPLLLKSQAEKALIGPGALDDSEEKFVRDLVSCLSPSEEDDGVFAPLIWHEKKVWFKRNFEKDERSFRVRADDSDWFYPDFVIWIVDENALTQTIAFVDPKGLAAGGQRGWEDYKVVCTNLAGPSVELSLAGSPLEIAGKRWSVRIRGVLISTTPYALLSQYSKFAVFSGGSQLVAPSKEDFARGRILFQEDSGIYIEQMFERLSSDSEFDAEVVSLARQISDSEANGELVEECALFGQLLRSSGMRIDG